MICETTTNPRGSSGAARKKQPHSAPPQRRAYLPHRSSPMYYHPKTTTTPALEDVDDEDDFMMRIVHGSCQGAWGDHSSLCHVPEHLDLLVHCQQPLSFLSFFRERGADGGELVDDAMLPAGAYMMPTSCEYCGQADAKLCRADSCHRPALYFQKKRPPFCHSDARRWDPLSDYAIATPPPPQPPQPSLSRSSSPFEGSWVSGLFLRGKPRSRIGASPTP